MSYRTEKHLKQTPEVKKIIYDLACEFGHKTYSTIDEIDYKFWEDIQPEDIAYSLASDLQKLKEKNEKLVDACNKFLELFRESDMRPEDECNELYDQIKTAIEENGK